MRILAIFVLTVFTLNAIAQKSPIEKVIHKYGDKDGISTQIIDPGSEEIQSRSKVGGDEINNALAKLETIKIIKADSEEASQEAVNKFYSKAVDALDDKRYSEIIKIKSDDGEDVSMHINQLEDGSLKEMVFLINQGDGFIMVYVKGEINISDFNFAELISAFAHNNKDKDSEDKESGGD